MAEGTNTASAVRTTAGSPATDASAVANAAAVSETELQTQQGAAAQAETAETAGAETAQQGGTEPSAADVAELARLRAEVTRLTNRADTLAKENASQKRELRSYKTAEEIREEEKREADAERDRKIAEYEKRLAVAETSKKVLPILKDEATATAFAEALHGADDADNAIDILNKAWATNERKLRAEYGRIPMPGAGSGDGPTLTREQLDAMGYTARAKFANEHPEEYEKLMGR